MIYNVPPLLSKQYKLIPAFIGGIAPPYAQSVGLSRQKVGYLKNLAEAFIEKVESIMNDQPYELEMLGSIYDPQAQEGLL